MTAKEKNLSFWVESSLKEDIIEAQKITGVLNRSDFIRNAVEKEVKNVLKAAGKERKQ